MTELQEAISKTYWSNIKNGGRSFADIDGEVVQAEVKRLAALDVNKGKLAPSSIWSTSARSMRSSNICG